MKTAQKTARTSLRKSSYLFRTFRVKQAQAVRAVDADKSMGADDALRVALFVGLPVRTEQDIEDARAVAFDLFTSARMDMSTAFALNDVATVGR